MIQKIISKLDVFLSQNKRNNSVISGFNNDEEAINSEENVDMTNVVHSIFLAKSLYNQLKVKCHPDRFVHDKELVKISTAIFQKLSENRRNLKMLIKIKEEAINNLKIKA